MINTLFPPRGSGGAERSVSELATELTALGHDVTVATLIGPREARSRSVDSEIMVVRIPSRSFLPFMRNIRLGPFRRLMWHSGEIFRPIMLGRLLKEARLAKPDVIHLNNIAGFGGSTLFLGLFYPTVFTMRDYYIRCLRSTMFKSTRACVGNCRECFVATLPRRRASLLLSAVTAVSEFTLETNIRAMRLGRQVLTAVVYNSLKTGVPGSPAVNTARPRAGQGVTTVGFLGSITAEKGIQIVVDAAGLLPSDEYNFQIAGLAPAGYKIINAGNNVAFVGQVKAEDFLKSLDILVVPSQWHEPFGRVAIEGLRAGCSVLASNVGGLAEIGARAGIQLVANYTSPASWAEKLAAIRQSGGGELLHLPENEITQQYLAVYASVVKTKVDRPNSWVKSTWSQFMMQVRRWRSEVS